MLPIIIAISIAAILFILKAATLWMRYYTTKHRLSSKPNFAANQPLFDTNEKILDHIEAMLDNLPPLPPLPPLPTFSALPGFPVQYTVVGYGGGGTGNASGAG